MRSSVELDDCMPKAKKAVRLGIAIAYFATSEIKVF